MTDRATNRWFAALAIVVPFAVYLRTMARQLPFWDAGEFTAVAKILGIPHPPGTPLFVLTAHVFGMLLPMFNYATRITMVSVVVGLLTLLCTYLFTQKLVMHLPMGEGDDAGKRRLSYFAGVITCWFTAFSYSFWNTSNEIAHVHIGASAIMFFALYSAVTWWERQGEEQNERRLLMIWYLMCLGIGWHLGGFLVLPAVALFSLIVDPRRSWWLGLGVAIFATWYKWSGVVQDSWHVQPESTAILYSALGFLVPLLLLHFVLPRHLRPFLWVSAAALVAGISVHAYLIIRAAQNPVINEAAPRHWQAFWEEFTRQQYAPPSIFDRQGTWAYQLDYMFWRYFRNEFTLGPPFNSAPGVTPWTGFLATIAVGIPLVIGEFGRLYQLLKGQLRAEVWALIHMGVWVVALLLYNVLGAPAAAIGLVFAMLIVDLLLAIFWKRELFVLTQSAFLLGTLWLVLYLNFKDPQVRERHYFFLWGYEVFAVWIGVGFVTMLHEGLQRASVNLRKPATVTALCTLGLVLPALTCLHFFFEQDHTGNYMARDYAYNMLEPLAKDAVIFTNGDNDTFPLWYLQEVEGIRKDVRVICLSLLNTHWYIKQLRDLEPRVPISLTDAEVDALEPYREQSGNVVWVKDIMVKHIVEENKYRKPIYVAVSVPDGFGLENHFSLEGLAFRVLPDTQHPPIDIAATHHALYDVFLYRGLLDAQGRLTPVPFKDENQLRMASNYSAAHVRLAFAYQDAGRKKEAVEEMDRAGLIHADFPGLPVARASFYQDIGDTAKATAVLAEGAQLYPTNPEILYRLGVIRMLRGNPEGLPNLEAAHRYDPDNGNIALGLFSALAQLRRIDEADQMMQEYLSRHPEDQQATSLYNAVMRSVGRRAISTAPVNPGGLPSMPLPGGQ